MENKTLLEIIVFCFPDAWWDILFRIIFPSSTGFVLKGCSFSGTGSCFFTLRSCPCFLIAAVANGFPSKGDLRLLPSCKGTDLKNLLLFCCLYCGISWTSPSYLQAGYHMVGQGGEERNLSELWTSISQRAGSMGYMRFISTRQQMHGGWKSNFQQKCSGLQSRQWEHW